MVEPLLAFAKECSFEGKQINPFFHECLRFCRLAGTIREPVPQSLACLIEILEHGWAPLTEGPHLPVLRTKVYG